MIDQNQVDNNTLNQQNNNMGNIIIGSLNENLNIVQNNLKNQIPNNPNNNNPNLNENQNNINNYPPDDINNPVIMPNQYNITEIVKKESERLLKNETIVSKNNFKPRKL